MDFIFFKLSWLIALEVLCGEGNQIRNIFNITIHLGQNFTPFLTYSTAPFSASIFMFIKCF